ncbi:GNAT family N-acetyltransferase [Domibacillus antri]|uniref:GNAT family N-acetyltransferase n=1 Tax=Domibacillus antri TaxID=1714264 RepID=A0A1Q8Q1H7_9BACI|nr:GNAT family N-acetyltransferase [Domibacillus antri]OLN21193.1 GNAT family N-acetyltransferase [Domibacillus antri]
MNPIEQATIKDAEEILSLQKLAYVSEAEIYNDYTIHPLTQTLEESKQSFESSLVLKYVEDGNIIGSVRAFEKEGICYIGKLMVHPDHQNKGIGRRLMQEIESRFPGAVYELFTGSKSVKNISLYEKLGYKGFKQEKLPVEDTVFLYMRK